MKASLKNDEDISSASVCKMIATDRRNAKKVRRKSISVPLFKEAGYTLYSIVLIRYNPQTNYGGLSSANGLKYNGWIIYPSTHKKRKCINENGINAFLKRRIHNREWWRRHGKESRAKRRGVVASAESKVTTTSEYNSDASRDG